ncbi:hypothetical protein HDU98_009551 [Podochytrium sp. JEL0797]|nr:hypothetical protein HDU98_009551 [Podochytrium sp. JEL0797]
MLQSSHFNSALAIVTGVCTTLAAGVCITYGLKLMIRSHNTQRTLGRFRRRRKQVTSAVRAAEEDVAKALQPRLDELVNDAKKLDPTDSKARALLMRRAQQLDEDLIRLLERLDASDIATQCGVSVALSPSQASAATSSDLQPHHEPAPSVPSETAHTLIASPPASSSGNDSVSPSSAALSDDDTIVAPPSPTATTQPPQFPLSEKSHKDQQRPTSTFAFIGKLLPPILTSSTTASSIFSAYPPSLFFPTDELTSDNVEIIQNAVNQCRHRKRSLIKKIQKIATSVDVLFETLVVSE